MALIIRASLLSFYGKNVAKPSYDQKDDQFAKYCTVLYASQSSYSPSFLCFLSNRHFGTLTCWTPLRTKRWPICKILSHASESSFSATLLVLTISRTLWSSYREIVTWTNHDAKDGQFAKFCYAYKSSFTLSNLVLIVWTTLWSY